MDGMNFCEKCMSWYRQPGTCNCFAKLAPVPAVPLPLPVVPVVPFPAPVAWYCYACGQAVPNGSTHWCRGSSGGVKWVRPWDGTTRVWLDGAERFGVCGGNGVTVTSGSAPQTANFTLGGTVAALPGQIE